MDAILHSSWTTFAQALLAIAGTWLLAFGLKTVREAEFFDTSKPQPQSWRFVVGLGLLTVASIPQLLAPFIHQFRPPEAMALGTASSVQASSKPAEWDRMRQCAEQSSRLAARERWGQEPATDDIRATEWTNHYSAKYERCFVRVEFYNRGARKDKTIPQMVYLLYDGFEGHGLATCTDVWVEGASSFCSIDGGGEEKNPCAVCRAFVRDRMSN